MTDIQRREVEVDTALATLWEREQKDAFGIATIRDSLHSQNGERRDTWSRKAPWPKSHDQTEAEVREKLTNGTWEYETEPGRKVLAYPGTYVKERIAELDRLREDAKAARAEAQPLEAEYEATRWPRFFLVLNNNGHIHSSMHCSTTHPTTRWAWLPDLSGLTEEDAVEQQGPRLCSVCYPSAPVEWTLGLPKEVDPDRCAGSGQTVEAIRRYGRYGTCPVCGGTFGRSAGGKLRAHKTPKGK